MSKKIILSILCSFFFLTALKCGSNKTTTTNQKNDKDPFLEFVESIQEPFLKFLAPLSEGERIIYSINLGPSDLESVSINGEEKMTHINNKAFSFDGTPSLEKQLVFASPDPSGYFTSGGRNYSGLYYHLWLWEDKDIKRLTGKTVKNIRDEGPIWSPDGNFIYFQRATDIRIENLEIIKPPPNIWRMDKDGNNQTQLTFEGGDSPQVSPDGKTIAFLWKGGFIYFMGTDGSNVRAFWEEPAFNFKWSPDGKYIVFLGTNPETSMIMPGDLFLVDVEKKQMVRRLTDKGMVSFFFIFSPDSKKIAYTQIEGFNQENGHLAPHGPDSIWVMDIEGNTPPQQIIKGNKEEYYNSVIGWVK